MDAPTMDLGCALDMLATQGWFAERSAETRARLGTIAKLRSFTKECLIKVRGWLRDSAAAPCLAHAPCSRGRRVLDH